MAWVGKRGKYWFVRYRVVDETGAETQKRKSGFITKEDAWAAAKELEQKSNAGIDVHGDQETCGYIMERWFSEHCTNLADTTKSKYSDGIERLGKTFVYDLQVRKMNPSVLSTLINSLMAGEGGKKEISIRTATGLTEPLRLSFSWAADQGIIPVNPLRKAHLPKGQKRKQKILNAHDIDELVAASKDSAFYIPLLLVLYGGLRREEAAALKWDNVDLKHRTITIQEARTRTTQGKEVTKDTKTVGSNRTISMPRFVIAELRSISKVSDYVCVSSAGRPYQVDSFPQAVRRLIQSINTKRVGTNQPPMPQASYRDLRHTHVAMLIRMGVQPKVIQERLGHASIKITMDTYGYLMTGLQEGVADALDLDYKTRKSGRESGRKCKSGRGNIRVSGRVFKKLSDNESEENQGIRAI